MKPGLGQPCRATSPVCTASSIILSACPEHGVRSCRRSVVGSSSTSTPQMQRTERACAAAASQGRTAREGRCMTAAQGSPDHLAESRAMADLHLTAFCPWHRTLPDCGALRQRNWLHLLRRSPARTPDLGSPALGLSAAPGIAPTQTWRQAPSGWQHLPEKRPRCRSAGPRRPGHHPVPCPQHLHGTQGISAGAGVQVCMSRPPQLPSTTVTCKTQLVQEPADGRYLTSSS